MVITVLMHFSVSVQWQHIFPESFTGPSVFMKLSAPADHNPLFDKVLTNHLNIYPTIKGGFRTTVASGMEEEKVTDMEILSSRTSFLPIWVCGPSWSSSALWSTSSSPSTNQTLQYKKNTQFKFTRRVFIWVVLSHSKSRFHLRFGLSRFDSLSSKLSLTSWCNGNDVDILELRLDIDYNQPTP